MSDLDDRIINSLNKKIAKLESEKADILKMISELAQSESCSFKELDKILNKYKEK